jgi:hypothetical protein
MTNKPSVRVHWIYCRPFELTSIHRAQRLLQADRDAMVEGAGETAYLCAFQALIYRQLNVYIHLQN